MSSKKLPNKNLLMILIPVALLLTSILVFFLILNNSGHDKWFDPNWPYRKAIYIEMPEEYRKLEVDILVEVNTAELIAEEKLSSNCEDLRIVNEKNRELLSYNLEGGCNNEISEVWVRLPESRNTKRTIYMYYGNKEAQSVSMDWDPEEISQENISIEFGGEEVADVLGTTGSGPSQPGGPEVEGSTNPTELGTSTPGFSTTFEHPDYP
jgi:hypothetical protein